MAEMIVTLGRTLQNQIHGSVDSWIHDPWIRGYAILRVPKNKSDMKLAWQCGACNCKHWTHEKLVKGWGEGRF